MFALVPKMAAQPERQGCDLTKVIVNDEHILPDPKFLTSPGIYGGFVLVHRQSGRQWKLDFWVWDSVWYDQRRNSHHDLQRSLQGADRDLILRLKRSDGYGHAFFSVDVYAFALANAGDSLADFERFLTLGPVGQGD